MTTSTTIRLLLSTLGALGLLMASMNADSRVSFAKTSESTVEIRLQNDEPVAGLQFAIRSSANVSLQSIVLDGRTTEAWMISSNAADDSTLYVVLIRTGMQNLVAGSGTIARLTIRTVQTTDRPYVLSFDNVVAATPAAASLAISAEPLEWSGDATSFTLRQNFPNPFNPSTTIPYVLQQPSRVNLTVYDIAGRVIKKISEGIVPEGEHSATWSGSDESGAGVPSGVYIVRLQVGDKSDVRKMILAR